VKRLFTEYIKNKAEAATSRSHYNEVCGNIKALDKACPGAADEICAEIIKKYSKRPAFMDEMRKINKHST